MFATVPINGAQLPLNDLSRKQDFKLQYVERNDWIRLWGAGVANNYLNLRA